jgi:hypothetical protein
MPLDPLTIQATLEAKLTAAGFDLSNEHCATSKLTKAIAETIHHEMTANAVVNTTGGPAAQTGTIS